MKRVAHIVGCLVTATATAAPAACRPVAKAIDGGRVQARPAQVGAIACLALLWMLVSGCDSGSHLRLAKASALTLFQARTPPLQVPNYRTSGTYPQVAKSKLNLRAVNAALRNAVLEDQRRYARAAQLLEAQMPQLARKAYPYPGVYETSTNESLISASSVVVSALIPALELYPGGNDGDKWISVTVRVPSGARVGIGDLFTRPTQGLAALAAAARRKVTSADSCVRRSLKNEEALGVPFIARGFAPRAKNYRHFALTTHGLVIGFPIGQVGGSSCGRVRVTVAYDVVRAYLSKLGQSLVAGVRSPSAVRMRVSSSTARHDATASSAALVKARYAGLMPHFSGTPGIRHSTSLSADHCRTSATTRSRSRSRAGS